MYWNIGKLIPASWKSFVLSKALGGRFIYCSDTNTGSGNGFFVFFGQWKSRSVCFCAHIFLHRSLPVAYRNLIKSVPIFISSFGDTHSFLTCLRVFCSGALSSQLKDEKFMVVTSTAYGFRACVRALPSLWREGRCLFPHLLASGRPLCVICGEESE